jgi:hypothetical protein
MEIPNGGAIRGAPETDPRLRTNQPENRSSVIRPLALIPFERRPYDGSA